MSHNFKLGDEVYHPCDSAPFVVVGIREDLVEIKGDWSGGTHNINVADWVHPENIKMYDEALPTYYFNGRPYKRIEYFNQMEKALSICHDLLRDIDIYADQPDQAGWSVKNCSNIASKGLDRLYKEYPTLFGITEP